MAADIVPELYEQIKAEFEKNIQSSKQIQSILKSLEAETATGKDMCEFSRLVGECAADALESNLTTEKLPDGHLYWNIASRIIEPLLKEVHKIVIDAATKQWESSDKKNGIGMKCIRIGFPEDRVKDLINKIVEYWEADTDEQ